MHAWQLLAIAPRSFRKTFCYHRTTLVAGADKHSGYDEGWIAETFVLSL